MDRLSFLDGDVPADTTDVAQPAPEANEPPAEPQTPAEGPARGADGKFLPKEAKAEAEPAPAPPAAESPPQAPAPPPEAAQPAPEPEPAKPPEGFVPLAAFTALRDEFNSFKRQASQPPAEPPPDPHEDFDGWRAHQEAQYATERANWSRQLAEAKHGAELVQQAQQWAFERFDADPVFAQAAQSTRDPYGFAIQEYQRHQVMSLLSDPANFAKVQAFLAGQAQEQAAAAPMPPQPPAPPPPVVAPPPQPTPPPQSIAAAPSAGGPKPGHLPAGPGAAFDATFKD